MNHPIYCSLKRAVTYIILSLLLTGNLFSQWIQQVSGTQYPLHSVYFINNNTGFLASNSNNTSVLIGGEIIKTTNAGNNWERVLLDSNMRAKGFYFLDANTGFAVGGSYTIVGLIYKTINGGINWTNITPPLYFYHLFNIVFPDNITGYISGLDGVLKTTNSGTNWQRSLNLNHPPQVPRAKVFFLDVNTGFFVKDTASIYKTTNGGTNWQYSQLPYIPYFRWIRDIKFINDLTGYIVGDEGAIYKTTDQGTSWTASSIGTTQDLFSIFFVNQNTGFITAEHTVFKSTNSGSTWFFVFSLTADTLFSSYFNNPDTGYVCGDDGRVYKTNTGGVIGIKPVDPTVPVSYNLFQNYPNPFNPLTKIKFAVPKASVVRISVYDALGRELETLINESLQPGTYEVNWSAERFSSGVYFYKILANDFSMVKKMSLIK